MMAAIAPYWPTATGPGPRLVLRGGGLFAAFPGAYAVLMPAFYLPIVLMLLALTSSRGVAFEFRSSRPAARQAACLDHRLRRRLDHARPRSPRAWCWAASSRGVKLALNGRGFRRRRRSTGLTPYSAADRRWASIAGLCPALGAGWLMVKTRQRVAWRRPALGRAIWRPWRGRGPAGRRSAWPRWSCIPYVVLERWGWTGARPRPQPVWRGCSPIPITGRGGPGRSRSSGLARQLARAALRRRRGGVRLRLSGTGGQLLPRNMREAPYGLTFRAAANDRQWRPGADARRAAGGHPAADPRLHRVGLLGVPRQRSTADAQLSLKARRVARRLTIDSRSGAGSASVPRPAMAPAAAAHGPGRVLWR